MRRKWADENPEDVAVLRDIAQRMRAYDRLTERSRIKQRAGIAKDIPEADPWYREQILLTRPCNNISRQFRRTVRLLK
jgi:hypothetical protein